MLIYTQAFYYLFLYWLLRLTDSRYMTTKGREGFMHKFVPLVLFSHLNVLFLLVI